MTLYDRLIELKDASYRTFQMKLVPNISSETILVVRTPQMRALAKKKCLKTTNVRHFKFFASSVL